MKEHRSKNGRRGGPILVAHDGPAVLRKIASCLEQAAWPHAPDTEIRLETHQETYPETCGIDGDFDGSAPALIIPECVLDHLLQGRSANEIRIVIATTFSRREELLRAVSLQASADRNKAGSFNLPDLLARLRAALHPRELGPDTGTHRARRNGFTFNSWRLELRLRRLIDPNGSLVCLTKSEFALLCAFLESPRRPLSRAYLLQATRIHEDIFDRSIDVQVLRLRRKLEIDCAAPRVIRTERGVGYVFDATVESF